MTERLAEVIRNGLVESIHHGNIAVVNTEGQLISYLGNPEQIYYFAHQENHLFYCPT